MKVFEFEVNRLLNKKSVNTPNAVKPEMQIGRVASIKKKASYRDVSNGKSPLNQSLILEDISDGFETQSRRYDSILC